MPGRGETNGLYRSSVEVTNRSDVPMSLHVEPWGDAFDLRPLDVLRVDIVAPTRRAIPVSYGDRSVTVEGWEGSVAEVWRGEELLN
jgi:hypothetical protein